MSEIRIPDAALEAGARTLCNEQRLFWHGLTTDAQDIIRGEARAAFLAMLEAWPGMDYQQGALVTANYRDPGKIILPLPPQEASDDQ